MRRLDIVIASAECAPVAKAGGLGDFVQGLARELIRQGHRVEVVLPRYDCLRLESMDRLEKAPLELRLPYFATTLPCDLYQGRLDGIPCWFIDPRSPQDFFRRGVIYGEPDDPERFTCFAVAVLEFLAHTGRRPDVIHCHDWHTGLVPVLLDQVYRTQARGLERTRVCYTLHNLGYQGRVGEQVLRQVGLDAGRLLTPERLGDPADTRLVNLLKGGIVHSHYITTVSPSYAREILTTEQGLGLQATLGALADRFAGILNGIDVTVWNPLTDPRIPQPFGPDSLPAKARSKQALRQRLGLAQNSKPLLAVISRLDAQKGVELIRHALLHTLARGGQAVLLGSAQDPLLDRYFRILQRETATSPDCRLELGYDEDLAHLLYAAADLLVVPSLYEPCGLTQMIAMRYGTVPVVRRVGGLAGTGFDAHPSERALAGRNGVLFDAPTPEALAGALDRALGLWFEHPAYFRQLRLNGMAADHSWARPAQRYATIYEAIRVKAETEHALT